MIIVSIDPGDTTGYVVYDSTKKVYIQTGELLGTLNGVIDTLLGFNGDVYVCEDFRPRPGMGAALAKHERQWPSEIIGCLRYFLRDKLVLQQPAEKSAIKDAYGYTDHEQDAHRHLQVWLNKNMRPTYEERIRKALNDRQGT